MTRTQATGILTAMLIAVEQAGYTKHHVLAFGHGNGSLTVFEEIDKESLDKVEDLMNPLIPDGMNTLREYISDSEVEYLNYSIAFD